MGPRTRSRRNAQLAGGARVTKCTPPARPQHRTGSVMTAYDHDTGPALMPISSANAVSSGRRAARRQFEIPVERMRSPRGGPGPPVLPTAQMTKLSTGRWNARNWSDAGLDVEWTPANRPGREEDSGNEDRRGKQRPRFAAAACRRVAAGGTLITSRRAGPLGEPMRGGRPRRALRRDGRVVGLDASGVVITPLFPFPSRHLPAPRCVPARWRWRLFTTASHVLTVTARGGRKQDRFSVERRLCRQRSRLRTWLPPAVGQGGRQTGDDQPQWARTRTAAVILGSPLTSTLSTLVEPASTAAGVSGRRPCYVGTTRSAPISRLKRLRGNLPATTCGPALMIADNLG
jgi:hypothetical protein